MRNTNLSKLTRIYSAMRSSSRKAGLRAYDPNIKKWLVVAVVLTLPVVLSGCSGGFGVGSSASNPQGEFMQGSVVKGFPPVPAYPKAQIGETFGDGNVFGASLVSNDNLARVLDFYNKSLTLDGWETKLSQVSDTNYVFLIKNANYQGEIIVNTAADGKKTAITVNLNKREGIS